MTSQSPGRPTRATPAGRAYLDLQNAARAQQRDTSELLQIYALEGFLDRLASSPFAERLVLKGGVLLAVGLSLGLSSGPSRLPRLIQQIPDLHRSEHVHPRCPRPSRLEIVLGVNPRGFNPYQGCSSPERPPMAVSLTRR